MKKLLTRNLGLKLASLVLAFVLWFLVAQIYDPKDTVTFNNIQVRLVNTELLEEEGKVYEVLDNSNLVRVTVTGPQSIVKSELRRSDIVAEADMSKLTDINTIAITYYCENISNDSVEIKGNHDSVRLNVEDKTSKWIKLESNTIGDVASGYMIGNVTLDQTNIEVTGPKSAISQVDHAGVDINVTDSTTSLSANVDIKLYDADDNELVLESVKKNVDSAYMTVWHAFCKLFGSAQKTIGADGVAWASKKHPVSSVGSAKFSNLMDDALSLDAICAAQASLASVTTADGLPFDANYDLLLVSPDLESTAKTLCGVNAQAAPLTNPKTGLGGNPVYGMRYMVIGGADGFASGQWAIADSSLLTEALKLVYLSEPTVLVSPRENPLVTDYVAYVDFAIGFGDARAIIFSDPALATASGT